MKCSELGELTAFLAVGYHIIVRAKSFPDACDESRSASLSGGQSRQLN